MVHSPPEATVYSLDLPEDGSAKPMLNTTIVDDQHLPKAGSERRYCFHGSPVASKIQLLRGDSALFDFTSFHGKIDLFFIDGAHSHEYVKSDTLNALSCCHPGSVLAWHDYGRVGVNGVFTWLHEFSRGRDIYSVPGGSLAFMVVE